MALPNAQTSYRALPAGPVSTAAPTTAPAPDPTKTALQNPIGGAAPPGSTPGIVPPGGAGGALQVPYGGAAPPTSPTAIARAALQNPVGGAAPPVMPGSDPTRPTPIATPLGGAAPPSDPVAIQPDPNLRPRTVPPPQQPAGGTGVRPNTYQGIPAGETRTGVQAFQALSSAYGTPMTAAQQQAAAAYIGYTDQSGQTPITADQYNRLMQFAAQQAGGTYAADAGPGGNAGGVVAPGGSGGTPGVVTGGPTQGTGGGTPTPQSGSYQGIGPNETRTGQQAMEYLSQVYGQPMTAAQQQEAAAYIGYTDQTGQAPITAEQYNRLMQYAAQRAGGTYAPYGGAPGGNAGGPGSVLPTEGPLTPQPFPQQTVTPAPAYTGPQYQRQSFKPPTFQEMVDSDPTYQRRLNQGIGAMESRAAARGMLGTGAHLRDIGNAAQDYASNEFQNYYGRKADEYGLETGERRYGYEADTADAQARYAPGLLTWNRQEDQDFTGRQLTYDRNWQREIYGRDDNWRRNRGGEDDRRYRNDDMWRYRNEAESRRRFLAELGQR